jgi:SAM-dependent methyltransferase
METKESEIYENIYKQGYGHLYPESHIIRAYERFLKKRLPQKNRPKILDYGCGTGANLLFFKNKGFDVYGCDVSKTAIEKCKENKYFNKEQFAVCDETPNPIELFGSLKFDVILSNQTLYYLSDKSLNKFVIDAYDLIEDGGFLLATMMAKSHWFFSQVVSRKESLHKVDLRNTRFKRLSYINFKEKEELEDLFNPFKLFLLGFYTLDILPEEGLSDHWMYIGGKTKN